MGTIRQHRLWFLALVLVTAALGATPAAPLQDGSFGVTPGNPVVVASPVGLDDGWRPTDEVATTVGESAPPDAAAAAPPQLCSPASVTLAALTPAERANATIQLEDHATLRTAEGARIDLVETLWNSGRWDEALDVLRQLEATAGQIAVGVNWHTPIVAAASKSVDATDVRITAKGTSQVVLDADIVSGHLFAATRLDSGHWTMNMSTNNGRSWAETYDWIGTATDIDMVVVGDFVYVAYIEQGFEYEAKLRRCRTADGSIDNGYGYFVVEDVSPDDVVSVALTSNTDYSNDFVYYAYIRSDHTVHWYYELASDGTTFTERSPVVANAASSLDMHWATADQTNYFWYLSYLGTDDQIWVGRDASGSAWDPVFSIYSSYDGEPEGIHISSYGDVVIVAFEDNDSGTNRIYYRISYNGGTSWASSSFSPGAGENAFYRPDVSARGGQGIALTHQHEVGGEPDDMYFRMRPGYGNGSWPVFGIYNNQDVQTGRPVAIEWLAPIGCFGLAFIHGSDYYPYFDRWPGLFYDDFERHNTSAWSAVYP